MVVVLEMPWCMYVWYVYKEFDEIGGKRILWKVWRAVQHFDSVNQLAGEVYVVAALYNPLYSQTG